MRVLQNRSFKRIGGTSTIKSTARIIAATNQNLKDMILNGKFREDLYYRLSTFPLEITPIRSRENDALEIAEYLFEKFCKDFDKPTKLLTTCGKDQFMAYSWPGNVREMQNVISRIILLEPSLEITKQILLNYLPDAQADTQHDKTPSEMGFIADYSEKELLKIHANETFKLCNYNKSETAKRLGINYRTLIKRLSD